MSQQFSVINRRHAGRPEVCWKDAEEGLEAGKTRQCEVQEASWRGVAAAGLLPLLVELCVKSTQYGLNTSTS